MSRIFALSLILGLASAALLRPTLHALLRFRPQWLGLLCACTLTALVGVATFTACETLGLSLTALAAYAAAFAFGLLLTRLIIRSETGRALSWRASTVLAAVSVAPPVFIAAVFLLVADSL